MKYTAKAYCYRCSQHFNIEYNKPGGWAEKINCPECGSDHTSVISQGKKNDKENK